MKVYLVQKKYFAGTTILGVYSTYGKAKEAILKQVGGFKEKTPTYWADYEGDYIIISEIKVE